MKSLRSEALSPSHDRDGFSCGGLGSLLLADALGRILENSREVASALVVVDAKDDVAADFYRKHGFIPFGGSAGKLFLPMKTIAEAAQR